MSSTADTATSLRLLKAAGAIAISPISGEDTLDVSVTALEESLVRDHQQWLELASRAGVQFSSLLYDWHKAWAATASSVALARARVARVVDLSGNLLAILPFAITSSSLGLLTVHRLEWPIGDLACPDHLDLPLPSSLATTAIVRALHAMPWDVLRLESIVDDAPGAQRLAVSLAEHGCRVEWIPGEVCPYLDLPSSWDAYLTSLSPTRRQTIRRKERALFREHSATIVDYPAERLDEGWAHLCRLHHQYRPHGSAFNGEAAELQRMFAAALTKKGEVCLTTLDIGGTPVAAWYGFAVGKTMCFYQSGRDPAWEHASVGQVLMGMMIRRAIERGFRTFDFLRGDEPYKSTWTTTKRYDQVLVAYRRGLRGALARHGDELTRAARGARGFLSSLRPAGVRS